jgi:hypothetical protein
MNWPELLYVVGLTAAAIFAGQGNVRPRMVWICRYGISTEVWNDQVERYTFHEPDTTQCGRCGAPVDCKVLTNGN